MTTNDFPIVRGSGFHAFLLLHEFKTQFTQDSSNILIETWHMCAHTHRKNIRKFFKRFLTHGSKKKAKGSRSS